MNVDKDEEWEKRGGSFGAVAAAYAEHRPDYPEAAVRWALEVAAELTAGAGLSGVRVLDLGAGTGKLTAQLADLGADVTAVEPDPAMLTELRRQLPQIRALDGRAEAIPLPDGSVHAVLCGQAMHWFDMDRALPEIARVLARGGVLAGLWNSDDDRVEWVAGLQRVAEGAASPSLTARRSEAADYDIGLAGARFFLPTERAEFPNSQARTADSLVATIATHSKFLIMPAAERERVLAGVRDYLRSRPETGGEFALPMVTSAVRARRR
jgi:ubiquinone/menaquinone biosynthesis C-methylase UbiE